MAGGKFAEHVPCMDCLESGKLTKATRVHEGAESDQYVCELRHEFGMDWSRGPATESEWPPSPEYEAYARQMAGEEEPADDS